MKENYNRCQQVDCEEIIEGSVGKRYEHEYNRYIDLFRMLAESEKKVICCNVPSCWVPMIRYLGHEIKNVKKVKLEGWMFEDVNWDRLYSEAEDKRRVIEVVSVTRPELVHSLYCLDVEWTGFRKEKLEEFDKFHVTCNGSFFRQEIKNYIEKLRRFKPQKDKCVLVPCAAEKPYPASLHKKVKEITDKYNGWHIIIATGVLGLVPEELWQYAPLYDSGLPYIDRVVRTVSWYFNLHMYRHVVVYADFYAYAIKLGMDMVESAIEGKTNIVYLFGNHYRDKYDYLLLEDHLMRLEGVIGQIENKEVNNE